MSTIKPSQLASEITKALKDYAEVTEEAAIAGVSESADKVVRALREANPPGSGKYGSWTAYNGGWTKRKSSQKTKQKGFGALVWNEKHYQLTHLLEKGHALRGGGRAQAFPHIGPVAEEAENTLLDTIKKHIKQS